MLVHLIQEVEIARRMHCHWMNWVERYLHFIKKQVQNRAKVEGSIAKGYLALESMFYSSIILGTIYPHYQRGWVDPNDLDDGLLE